MAYLIIPAKSQVHGIVFTFILGHVHVLFLGAQTDKEAKNS